MGFGLFGLLDTNHDGVLDKVEIDQAPEILRKLDKDGDGKITQREIFPEGLPGGGDRPGFRRPDGEGGRPGARPEGEGRGGVRRPGGENPPNPRPEERKREGDKPADEKKD